MKEPTPLDLYKGNKIGKLLGFVAFVCLVLTAISLLAGQWKAMLASIAASIVASYGAYRIAGGRRNPGLIEQMALDYDGAIMEVPGLYWEDRIELLFSDLLKKADGNHALALATLEAKNAPVDVTNALAQARLSPDAKTWSALLVLMQKNPPKGARRL